MVTPGVVASYWDPAPPDLVDMGLFSLGEVSSFTYDSSDPAGWWTFTPPESGVVTIDSYLTTLADGTQPDDLRVNLVIKSGAWGMGSRYEGERQRLIVDAVAGQPIVFVAYGGLMGSPGRGGVADDNVPIHLRVRVSALATPSWEDLPERTVTIGISRVSDSAWDGNIMPEYGGGTAIPAFFNRSSSRGNALGGVSIVSGAGSWDCAWEVGRKSFTTGGTLPVCPTPRTGWLAEGITDGSWHERNLIGHSLVGADRADTATISSSGFEAFAISVTRMGSWANTGLTWEFPTPSADQVLMSQPATVSALQVALDESTDQSQQTPSYYHPFELTETAWYLTTGDQQPMTDTGGTTNAWGPMSRPGTTATFNFGGHPEGPEGFVARSRHLYTNSGGASGFIDITEAELEAARQRESDTRWGLFLTAMDPAALSSTPPWPVRTGTWDYDYWARGRWDPRPVLRPTFRRQYALVDLPEMPAPADPEITGELEGVRRRFT